MLQVSDALHHILDGVHPLPAEYVQLAEADGRVLAENIAARLTQPPFDASAMDGYAVQRADMAEGPVTLRVIGESAAGHPFEGVVKSGEAVRIFTGSVIPEGADHIIIQENTRAMDGSVEILELGEGDYIRPSGGDFREGEVLLHAGRRLTPRDLLLAAQMNHAQLPVHRQPQLAILASGDELVRPGDAVAAGQIVSSIPPGLAAMLRRAGAEVSSLGIAGDNLDSLHEFIERAETADLLVTIGGASVGDHDLMRQALELAGFSISLHKVAMRPGKPLMFGQRSAQRVVGLPGNPVSSMICGQIFLAPLIAAMAGQQKLIAAQPQFPLACQLQENGPREHYMRARFVTRDGHQMVEPAVSQDSSLTAILAAADCLIIRSPYAPAIDQGAMVNVIIL